MKLLCLGLSYRTAPVALRERLHYSAGALRQALARARRLPAALPEVVLLSTCNRLELYAAVEAVDFEAAADFIAATSGRPRAEFEPHLYRLTGVEAVAHLFRVAAGLDSLILGEPQILGQVADAYTAAREAGAARQALSPLFRAAQRAGRRARAETAISRNPASISSAAAGLAQGVVPDLQRARVLIVGAGEMAELAVEALRSRGARHITVMSRTLDRARQLAARWEGQALTYDSLVESLAESDIVITSTSAPHFIITPERAAAALLRRARRPLVLIDIAVPRDVAPEVARLPGVHYYDIDQLKARLDGALSDREQEVPRVEAILAEEAAAFAEWQRTQSVTPLITTWRARADAIRQAEVDRALRRLPGLGQAERQQIELLTQSLVNKLLHDPTLRLKAEAGAGDAGSYAEAVRHLFALNS